MLRKGTMKLEAWLAELKTDRAALNELCSSEGRGSDGFDADCAQRLIAYCQDVADAAGSLLGFTSARSEAEQAALKTIAAALEMHRAKNWRAQLS
jgi:hypothetical protein